MIEATKNQLTNIGNPYQTFTKRVLVVCSAGLLRSPTLANVLHKELGYNTRACGSALNFALIPISEALVHWCDELVFVDEDCKDYLDQEIKEEIALADCREITLNLPDQYDWMDDELQMIALEQYMRSQ